MGQVLKRPGLIKYNTCMQQINQTAAGGVVFKEDEQGNTQWLVCQHSYHKGWVFPKGIIGDTFNEESREEAALRETEEEGGVKAEIIAPLPEPIIYFYVMDGKKIKKTVQHYLMKYVSGDPADHDWEMDDAKFIPEEEVLTTLTYPSDKKAFEMALKLRNQKKE